MTENLQGKKIVVAGATRVFGQTIVEDLLQQGCTVYAISSSESELTALAEACTSSSAQLIPVVWDIKTTEEFDEAKQELSEKLPNDLDSLVNNSGITVAVPYMDNPAEPVVVNEVNRDRYREAIGVVTVVKEKMIAGGKAGTIVNVSAHVNPDPNLPMVIETDKGQILWQISENERRPNPKAKTVSSAVTDLILGKFKDLVGQTITSVGSEN